MTPESRYSIIQSIIENSIPVIGLIFFAWSPFIALFVYYLEMVISELFYIKSLKTKGMLVAADLPDNPEDHLPLEFYKTTSLTQQDISGHKSTIIRSLTLSNIYISFMLTFIFGMVIYSGFLHPTQVLIAFFLTLSSEYIFYRLKRESIPELLKVAKRKRLKVYTSFAAILVTSFYFLILLKLNFIPVLTIAITVVAIASILFDLKRIQSSTPVEKIT